MAKFCDVVGYAETRERRPGIWEETITERPYYGDVLRNTRRLEGADTINGDVTLNNRISIVADPYAYQHFLAIRYVKWMGVSWKVTNVEVQSPRLVLTIGGAYSGTTG